MSVFFKRLIMNLLYLLSYLSLRDKKTWVFGSYGNFNDNSRYLFLSIIQQSEIKAIWIAKNKKELDEVKKYHDQCYLRYSLKGIYYSLRAKVYIYSAYVSDINYFTSGNAICINLWHGIPLKKIEFDIKRGDIAHIFNKSFKSRFLHPWVYRKPDLVLSPSQFVADYSFKKAFEVKESQIILNTYPRVLALMEMQEKFVKSDNQFTFFYAPTWRDSNPDFLTNEFLNLEIIENFCIENNAKFLIKLHSNSKFKIDSGKFNYVQILDNSVDSNQAMVMSDCLITDYSSIYFDYLVLNKPILFYRFDEDEYKTESREFYNEIYKYIPGLISKNINGLLNDMKCVLNDKDKVIMESGELKNLLGIKVVNGNDYLIKKIGLIG